MTSVDGERARRLITNYLGQTFSSEGEAPLYLLDVISRLCEEVRREQRERDAQSLEIPAASILLICGEMSAQEMRTVKAFLKNRAEAIRGEKA